jgi:hypothetical protein
LLDLRYQDLEVGRKARWIAKLLGKLQSHRDLLRHRTVWAKEVTRPRCSKLAAGEKSTKSVDAGPMVNAINELILYWVGGDISCFSNDIVAIR